MINILLTIVFLAVLGLLVSFIINGIKKGASGLKIMILGINITLFGGIIVADPNSNLGGIEYLIALFGLFTSIIGFWKND